QAPEDVAVQIRSVEPWRRAGRRSGQRKADQYDRDDRRGRKRTNREGSAAHAPAFRTRRSEREVRLCSVKRAIVGRGGAGSSPARFTLLNESRDAIRYGDRSCGCRIRKTGAGGITWSEYYRAIGRTFPSHRARFAKRAKRFS